MTRNFGFIWKLFGGLSMWATKISKGIYEYKGYRISNCGYHEPDHCVWWESVDMQTECADYHATTKKFLMEQTEI